MITFINNYHDKIEFDEAKFKSVLLTRNERVQVMLVCFRPGQFIPAHTPDVDLTFTVLQGEGLLIAGDEEREIRAGAVACIPAGERRGIKALTEFVIMSAVTPPPTDADHTQVKEKLRTGTLR